MNYMTEFEKVNGRKPLHVYEALDFYETEDNKEVNEVEVDEVEKHVNPSHYKMIPPEAYERFPDGIEYFDLMTFVLKHHDPVHAHAIGQSLKYLLRAGKKDALVQDLKKARWYLNYLIEEVL